jgi:DNA polymerase-3 subunit delta'
MPFGDIIGHDKPKTWMRAAIQHVRLAHAYLFYGEEAIGKRLFAFRLAQALSCDTPPQVDEIDSCGQCRSCIQIEGLTHPDLLVISPDTEKANPQISIDCVRDLEHHVIYRPLFSPYKICVIEDADRLTLGAANALLKTLEEPPDHSLFFLITSRPAVLLSTVRSRCLSVPFTPQSQSAVEGALTLKRALPPEDARFLAFATGCRLGQALTMDVEDTRARQSQFLSLVTDSSTSTITDLLITAESLSKAGLFPESLTWFSSTLRDVLLARVGSDPSHLLNQEHVSTFQELTQSISTAKLFDLIEDLQALERAPKRNLNLQLNLEAFLLKLQETLTPSPA